MRNDVYDKFYSKVPQDQKERLRKFRSTHPYKHFTVDGVSWKYISCGRGELALLLLTGGTGIAEALALAFMSLENEYRIICPTYPPVTTMEQLADGIVRILESEETRNVNILGQSFGGILAQVIVHKYPEKVSKLILSHTTTTSPPVDQTLKSKKLKKIERLLKVLSFLPPWMFRFMFRRSISKMVSIMNTEERGFWDAYFHEMISQITKEELASIDKCMLDFGQNYKFSKDDLANWPGKILILESDNDPSFHQSEQEAIKRLYPQARVHTFQGTGHLTLIFNREKSISAVRNFLRGK